MSTEQSFHSKPSADVKRRLSSISGPRPQVPGFTSLTPMWAGIASAVVPNGIDVGISISDATYSVDYASHVVPKGANPQATAKNLEDHILGVLRTFSHEHVCKFLGVGVTVLLLKEVPNLCTRLWLDLDIVPIVFNITPTAKESITRPNLKHTSTSNSIFGSGTDTPVESSAIHAGTNFNGLAAKIPLQRTLDEQADSAARKCVMHFGPGNNPRLSIGAKNHVSVDAGGKIHLLDDIDEYRKTVSKGTWNSVIKYADELRDRKVKIGFFSSTPQGGGVALMRHALIRFLAALDVDCTWYVPNPSPAVFRITKNNHNILQGVAAPSLRLTKEQRDIFDAWIQKNGTRWLAEGGPLAPGGVDIAFIDDPQMPGLIPMIRKARPELPIIYRSHIEIRSDLTSIKGSPQSEVWEYLYNNIKLADLFISHPVAKFVPADVPKEKLALLGAATDFLDGLNKHLNPWDSQYYMGVFRDLCRQQKMNELQWPAREYIVQIARFDPAKGIPNVIDSYVRFRKALEAEEDPDEHPQLLICGHGAVDDPDASIIYDQVMQLLQRPDYRGYAHDIVVMRLPPSDQLLNALMANSYIALQLSIREGFEVKVSEALHAGKPIVACLTGGIPLQVQHGKNGYLTKVGDNEAVAKHLYDLWTDEALYKQFSSFAAKNVSDEVGTIGNAAAWLYLAAVYTRGEKLTPNGAWLNDLLREEAGEPYAPGEPRLPRQVPTL
ncbi:trehalose phosphorylase [Sistotremastrum suecicum HHB10207 ss-3]|uniref:Trehalose phosphorylase n=1 Tax=Sistotremastrum suecicum HHB10207 ss-3 TaxID=1314776 RepID=A0A166IVP4_9AGAM|nr:trehalose phosphorylase [Sistotremastrum suecicum HHB10207 ss-3]